MFKTSNGINLKDYLLCNLYYLRRYVGIKEPILLGLLWVAGVLMITLTGRLFIIIMAGVTTGLILIAVGIYVGVTVKTFKLAFKDRGATKWDMYFDVTGYLVETFEKGGEAKYPEKRLFADVEHIAIRKDVVYVFGTSAICYYVKPDSFTEGNFPEFCEWLKSGIVPKEKFSLRAKKSKIFPYIGKKQ